MPRPSIKTQRSHRKAIDDWNASVPVGNAAAYYSVLGDESTKVVTSTKSEAFLLAGHTPCVWIVGPPRPKLVAIANCKPF